MRFPNVTGRNLVRKKFDFPQDFKHEYNCVAIAFKRYHQDDVDTWIPSMWRIEDQREEFRFYEMPTLWEMRPLRRFMLNEGMRIGIPEKRAHLNTITLYLDKEEFRNELAIPDESQIVTFLLDQEGVILWRKSGRYDLAYEQEILEIMDK